MDTALSSQAAGFVAFFASGVLLSAVYDILRIWRALFRSEKRSIFMQDFLSMILAALFTFLVNLGVNGGEIRLYLLFGEALGWCAWHFTIGFWTVRLFRLFSDFLYEKIFRPIQRALGRTAGNIGNKAVQFINVAKKFAFQGKKRLKRRGRIVYNQHKGNSRRRAVRHRGKDRKRRSR